MLTIPKMRASSVHHANAICPGMMLVDSLLHPPPPHVTFDNFFTLQGFIAVRICCSIFTPARIFSFCTKCRVAGFVVALEKGV